MPAIKEAVASAGIELGAIVGACGALEKATFRNLKVMPARYPVPPDCHLIHDMEGPLEIVSLTGWFSVTPDRQFVHAHCSASKWIDGMPVVVGGHVLDAVAGSKVVITLLEVTGGTARLGLDGEESMSDDMIFS